MAETLCDGRGGAPFSSASKSLAPPEVPAAAPGHPPRPHKGHGLCQRLKGDKVTWSTVVAGVLPRGNLLSQARTEMLPPQSFLPLSSCTPASWPEALRAFPLPPSFTDLW